MTGQWRSICLLSMFFVGKTYLETNKDLTKAMVMAWDKGIILIKYIYMLIHYSTYSNCSRDIYIYILGVKLIR